MAVAKKIKTETRIKLRRRPKARIPRASAAPNRPVGYFKDALTAEDIEHDNRVAKAVARMNARHASLP
jgi:hypothetical protein